jgi:DNA repair exonuclease SbcCD ATPase subunit
MLNKEIEPTLSRGAHLEDQIIQQATEIKRLMKEHESHKTISETTISGLQNAAKSLETELCAVKTGQKESDKMKVDCLKLLSENERQNERITELEKTIELQNESSESISRCNVELETIVKDLEINLKQEKTRSSNLRAQFQSEAEKVNEKMEKLEKTLNQALENEKKAQSEHSYIEKKYAELETTLKEISEELENERTKVRSMQEAFTETREAAIKTQNLKNAALEKIEAFKAEKATYIARVEEERIKEREKYGREADTYRVKEVQRLQSHISSLEKQKVGLEKKLKERNLEHENTGSGNGIDLNEMVGLSSQTCSMN